MVARIKRLASIRGSTRESFAISLVLSVAFASLVANNGIPSLRQDWVWPHDFASNVDFFTNATSGWMPDGFGLPNPYPDSYLFGSAIVMLCRTIGYYAGFVAFCTMLAFFAARSAAALYDEIGRTRVGLAAAQILAVFNPWVYTEIVAGHYGMIFAYAFTMALVAMTLSPRPQQPACFALAAIATLVQIQFFLFALVLLAIDAVRRRDLFALASALLVASPSILGIILERRSLEAISFYPQWQDSQSIAPLDALAFTGYFAKYGSHFAACLYPAMFTIVAISVFGLIASIREIRIAIVGASTAFLLCVAMGTKGPFAIPYEAIITRVPEAAVIRELYDIVGVVAIGTIALSASAEARRPWTAILWLVASLTVAGATFWVPPSTYWVDVRGLPAMDVTGAIGTRFALMPPFQPLRFNEHGSGADPDAYERSSGSGPLNEYLATFPVDAAFATYTVRGDRGPLRALGVTQIVERPAYEMDSTSDRPAAVRRSNAALPGAMPFVSIAALEPPITSVDAIGANSIFFADASSVRGRGVPASWAADRSIHVARPSPILDAARGWIDVHRRFRVQPELAQGIGGAFTTSSSATLPIGDGADVLAWVRGRLFRDRQLSGTTTGYRWISLRGTRGPLRCRGACAVIATGSPPNAPAVTRPAAVPNGVGFAAVQPWFIIAQLPAGDIGLLRLNNRFDIAWEAFEATRLLPHVRVGSAMNGWIVSRRRSGSTVFLIERVAALQAIAETLGLLWCVALLLILVRQRGWQRSNRVPTDRRVDARITRNSELDSAYPPQER